MCSFAFVNILDFLELDIGHCDCPRPAAANRPNPPSSTGMRLLSCSERRIAVETKIRKGKENAEEGESVNESK